MSPGRLSWQRSALNSTSHSSSESGCDFPWHFEVPSALRPDFDKLAAHEATLAADIGKSALRGRTIVPESFSTKNDIPLVWVLLATVAIDDCAPPQADAGKVRLVTDTRGEQREWASARFMRHDNALRCPPVTPTLKTTLSSRVTAGTATLHAEALDASATAPGCLKYSRAAQPSAADRARKQAPRRQEYGRARGHHDQDRMQRRGRQGEAVR